MLSNNENIDNTTTDNSTETGYKGGKGLRGAIEKSKEE